MSENSQVMGGVVIKNLTPIQEPPYDGTVNVLSDRRSGWKVRHAFLDSWIEGIGDRAVADRIAEAFQLIADRAYASGKTDQ